MSKVLNAHIVGKSAPGAVYIGRPSKWGNPFSIGKDGTREEVLSKYIDWLHENPAFVADVRRELVNKDLICWCAPRSCHGDILLSLARGGPLPQSIKPAQGRLF